MALARDHLVVLYEVDAVDVVAVPVGLREAAIPQEAAADDALKVALVDQALKLPDDEQNRQCSNFGYRRIPGF